MSHAPRDAEGAHRAEVVVAEAAEWPPSTGGERICTERKDEEHCVQTNTQVNKQRSLPFWLTRESVNTAPVVVKFKGQFTS